MPFSSFITTLNKASTELLHTRAADLVNTQLMPAAQSVQCFVVDGFLPFRAPPVIKISYLAGAHQEVILKLPIVLDKFLEPLLSMTYTDFETKWDLLADQALESRQVHIIGQHFSLEEHSVRLKHIISGHRWGYVLDQDREAMICAAGILHLRDMPNVGCLLRLQAYGSALEICVRSSSLNVSDMLLEALMINLSAFAPQ